MNSKYLAVILPGTGYHKDKPLMYYATKLALQMGYDVQQVDYLEYFETIRYQDAQMKAAAEKAFEKTEKVLGKLDLTQYTGVVFIGKSFGTVASARYISEHKLSAKQVWYTPVPETFAYGTRGTVAFTGSRDPIMDTETLRQKASELGMPLYVYEGGNHSLETGDVDADLETLRDVMRHTREYL